MAADPPPDLHGPPRRRSMGQHFLRDPRVVDRIMETAALAAGMRVLEVGPGDGALTAALSDAVGPSGRVVAVEADPRFVRLLAGRGLANVDVVQGDAVSVPLAARFDRIVANLPYQISGPVTARFLAMLRAGAWDRAVLMYQKEFADRILAPPGTRAYGRLTVHVARLCLAKRVLDVGPGSFDPPPAVHSTVLHLIPRSDAPRVADERLWATVVDGAFQQRRKQLRNTLPDALAGLGVGREAVLDALGDLGIARRRPEELAPEMFAVLCDLLVGAR